MSSKFKFALWLIARFMLGGLFLCSLAFLQRFFFAKEARFQLVSYIMPLLYGGFSMAAIGYLERRRRELALDKLAESEEESAQRTRESQERNAELVQVNRKLQAESARNRQVTEALRESEEKFRTMYGSSVVGIAKISLDFRITQANTAYLQMLGYKMEELRGKKLSEITYPEDVPANMEQQIKLGRGEIESYQMRKRFIHQDGRTVWGLLNANLIRDEEGQPAYFMGNVVDITAEVQAESALRESEGRFAAFMDRFPGAVFIKDAENRYVYFNSYYQRVFKFQEQLLGKFPAEVWPPELAQKMMAEDKLVLDQGYQVLANRLPDRDGGEHYYETHKFPIPRPNQPPLVGGIALDITARVAAEEEIRRLSTVIEQTAVTVVITDLEGDIVYANPYFETSTGYTVAAALGQNPRFLKSDQQEAAFYQKLWDTITAGQTWHGTFINRRKDGELYHEEATIFPIKNTAGETINYAAIKQDITARVRAEERQAQLLAQQVAINELALALGGARDLNQLCHTIYQYVQTLMDAWMFIISFYDDETELIRAGYVVLAGTQLDVTSFPPIPLAEPGQGVQSQVIRTGEPLYAPNYRQALAATSTEYHVHENGVISAGPPPAETEESVTQSTLYVPLKITGKTIGVLQVQSVELDAYCPEDMTLLTGVANVAAVAIQNVRLLEQISQQARQIEETINAVPEGVLLLDAQMKIVLANPLGKEDLAVLADVQVGEELTQLHGKPLTTFLTSAAPGGGWHELKLEGETPQYFELLARPLEPGAEQQGWVLVIRNVTREWEARARAQRQERLAAIGQLSAGIAHDFRNLLAGIILYAQLSQQQFDLVPGMKQNLEIIIGESKKAADLVGQILDFSRSSTIDVQPLDLQVLIVEVLELLRRTIPESVQLTFTAAPGEYTLAGDAGRLQQLLTNLALNARDAMPGGGTLHIELSNMVVAPPEPPPLPELSPGEWICLTVSDTGTGMTAEVRTHIFEPFFTTKDVDKGTGLGLAQVHGIVKLHGGYIDLESRLGRGTTFYIYLPVHLVQEEVSAVVAARPFSPGQGETILLVEDNTDLLLACQQLLESLGYRVLTASNGEAALGSRQTARWSKGNSPAKLDLVITDLIMPKMNGEELVAKLRRKNPTLKALGVTGYVVAGQKEMLRASGFRDVLHKPFDFDVLAQTVRRILDE